jgi:hypothetical protein
MRHKLSIVASKSQIWNVYNLVILQFPYYMSNPPNYPTRFINISNSTFWGAVESLSPIGWFVRSLEYKDSLRVKVISTFYLFSRIVPTQEAEYFITEHISMRILIDGISHSQIEGLRNQSKWLLSSSLMSHCDCWHWTRRKELIRKFSPGCVQRPFGAFSLRRIHGQKMWLLRKAWKISERRKSVIGRCRVCCSIIVEDQSVSVTFGENNRHRHDLNWKWSAAQIELESPWMAFQSLIRVDKSAVRLSPFASCQITSKLKRQ